MGNPPVATADATITPDLAMFLQTGLIMFLGTRSADLTPTSVIASGLRVDGPHRITVFVAEAVGARTFSNLADNGEMAVTMSNVVDHRSIQIKGRRLVDGPASESDRAFQAQYMERLRAELTMLGVPRSVAARIVWWPSRAIQMDVRDLFLQTPGANAGRRLEAGGGSLLRGAPSGLP
jgi:hypothetical protein